MSARAHRARRSTRRGPNRHEPYGYNTVTGQLYYWPTRADLARIRRVETQQRRLDRRYDRHERHRTCRRGELSVTLTADTRAFMYALGEAGIALDAWQRRQFDHTMQRALIGAQGARPSYSGLLR